MERTPMDSIDDEDIRLQRASAGLLSDLRASLEKGLWKNSKVTGQRQLHRGVRQQDLNRFVSLIEPFQEEPQLLDTQLKHVVPILVSAYLEHLRETSQLKGKAKVVTLSHALCRILYTFCKVRGEKVIVGFLNNEPRYLEPILDHFENGLKSQCLVWEEKYVALLWLSHLMLAPFDLASISSNQPAETAQQRTGIDLPDNLPGVVNRIVPICIEHLDCATRERNAAASLLVRLSLRPDMRKIGLLDALSKWALSFFSTTNDKLSDIHRCLGILSFLSGLVASANKDELGSFITDIYRSCDRIISQDNLVFVRSSAVARKLVIKTFRNIIIHALQSGTPEDNPGLLEDVIDFLLQSVGDGDTPVRYAASKALSVITMKLDPGLGAEVVEALLGCLNEDVLWEGSSRNLNAVNPLRWHGLTLTLSHLLYRRAPSTDQLPDILNALLLALHFEQRSATGGSIGTNVRDAACFGIWALSRRYTTKELFDVQTPSIRAAGGHDQASSIPQILAIELLVTACLDPAGNIRRGASAALQELIGRHPDTVEHGIPLVQIVDFHAVGLRDRAISEVGYRAAQLSQIYWNSLLDGLLGWRGVGSLDASSRISTANALGLLSTLQPFEVVRAMFEQTQAKLERLSIRDIEERHGLVLSLASLITACSQRSPTGPTESKEGKATTLQAGDILEILDMWKLFEGPLNLQERSFTSPALRPELTAAAICTLISALAEVSNNARNLGNVHAVQFALGSRPIASLDLCLGRTEDSVLRAIPYAVKQVAMLLKEEERATILHSWLSQLGQTTARIGLRGSGYVVALGAIYSTVFSSTGRAAVLDILTLRCTTQVEVEARVVALQSLQLVIQTMAVEHDAATISKVIDALHAALNDYTINERGDVGSLVRLEALNAIDSAWQKQLLVGLEQELLLHAAVNRLSLEKLDKVRTRAAACLQNNGRGYFKTAAEHNASGVSSYTYFSQALKTLCSETSSARLFAVIEGYINSAGMGSESVVQASRLALAEKLVGLPIEDDNFSQLHVTNILLDVFKANLTNERVVLPLLETVAFLLDARILQRLIGSSFKWRNLLSLVQKAHYKSNNIQKLYLALDVYRGLAEIQIISSDVISKLSSMLLHPFPKIRVGAAETLFVVTTNAGLKHHDWSQPPKDLRQVADVIRKSELHS